VAFDPGALAPGDVVLVAGGATTLPGKLLDALIRWSTGSPFTHAALAIGGGEIIEGVGTVQVNAASKYARIGYAFSVKATDAQRESAVAQARRRLGRPYGARELLLDAARFDLHWIPRWARPLRYTTCSGLVAACYAAAGVALTYAPWPAPGDLGNSPALVGPRPWEGVRTA